MPIALEIVSPERLLLDRPVDMAVIPASEGDMGVMEGHTPTIVMLRGGVISLYQGDQVTDKLYVSGGFAEVTPERCTVLANMALPVVEIVRTTAERLVAEAQADYLAADKTSNEAEELAQERVQSAEAMLEAVQGG